jgi:regulator of cell morphogenesis and NO signaling
METLNLLDLRDIDSKDKNEVILDIFDQLHPGDILTIIHDRDFSNLYFTLKTERPLSFTWDYLIAGPKTWKVNITKIKTRNELSIGEIVRDNPEAASVFRKYNIEYCCHGKMIFEEACLAAGADPKKIKRDINLAAKNPNYALRATNWPVEVLIDYLVNNHHSYLKSSENDLKDLAERVAKDHGNQHPELYSIKQYLNEFFYELNTHMMKEEELLFPTIKDMANNTIDLSPSCNFGPISKPLEMLETDHEDIVSFIDLFRSITKNYQIPEDVSTSFRLFYILLQDLEEDLRQHMHLENNILFPKAKELEEEMKGS